MSMIPTVTMGANRYSKLAELLINLSRRLQKTPREKQLEILKKVPTAVTATGGVLTVINHWSLD
ncbi:MAG: hypothetical protein ACSI46_09840 [Gloeotrichia echinulata DVL01]